MHNRRIAFLGVLAMAAAAIAVGCGPTDTGISTKVKTNLSGDETVKTAQIEVGVQKKVVTLSGTVDSSAVKEQAVVVARRTDGVAEVVDKITVREGGPGSSRGPDFGHDMMQKGMKMEGKDHPKEGQHE